jgi:hypothetical protein
MTPKRESLKTDALAILLGLGMIEWGMLNLRARLGYLPGDIRGEPWFHPAESLIVGLIGLLFILVGALRLIEALRARW